jgi:hypothetical protein
MDENFAMGYAMGQDNGNNNNGNGLFGGDGGWLGILLLIALLGGGIGWGGGFGGFGGGAGLQGMATRADINEAFALNNITSGITAIQQGICDATYAINNGLRDVGMNMMQGFNGVERGFCDIGYAIKDCCCTTQRAIDGVNYNMATQTNALQTAMCTNTRDIIDSQQAGTRAILDFLTQDKISTLTAENQALKFAASQAQQNAFITANQDAQTAELIRRLGRDCPVPAFVVPNPNCCYGNPVGVGYNGYGNGCGCTCA